MRGVLPPTAAAAAYRPLGQRRVRKEDVLIEAAPSGLHGDGQQVLAFVAKEEGVAARDVRPRSQRVPTHRQRRRQQQRGGEVRREPARHARLGLLQLVELLARVTRVG